MIYPLFRLDEFGQPMGSTVSGQDADFETIPEGTATDASIRA
jgi:hypothetical protein